MKKRPSARSASHSLVEGEQRINKVLAAAGLGSRRQVDELIEQGRVEIDGKPVQQVGVKVNPETVTITVDGEPLKKHRPVYFALNKPEGVLCTNRDPQGRARVVDMVPNQVRLFPVGRLDASSTGLILLTNDGELAQRLTHPKHGVPKRYAVVVAGQVENDSLRRLQKGIHLAEGRAKVEHAKLKRVRKGCTELEITLSEGKNREIRRVLARLGHKVVSLKRIAIGPLKMGELPEGAYRPLGSQEVAQLYEAVEAIKRERKLERKARKKSLGKTDEDGVDASSEPGSLERSPSETTSKGYATKGQATKGPRGKQRQPFAERESLPPMTENPYRTDDDFDDEDQPFEDEAVLVRDFGSDDDGDDFDIPITGNRRGAVIADEEDVGEGTTVDDEERVRRPRRGAPRSRAGGSKPARAQGGRPAGGRKQGARPAGARPAGGRAQAGRPQGGRPQGGRPARASGGAPKPEGARASGDRRARANERGDEGGQPGADRRSRPAKFGRKPTASRGGPGSGPRKGAGKRGPIGKKRRPKRG